MTVWIVGGGGIGEATRNCIVADKEIDQFVYSTTGFECDVRRHENIRRHYELISEHAPTPISHVVFTAGINRLDRIDHMGPDQFDDASDVVGTNLGGFINLCGTLGSHDDPRLNPMRIVAVSSDAAERPMRTSMAYCASKSGLNMAVKVAARELGPMGWRINAVAPGMTAPTGMSEYIDQRVPEVRGWGPHETASYEESQQVVPGRIKPLEVAEVIKSTLYGPDHLNGSIITINGGR